MKDKPNTTLWVIGVIVLIVIWIMIPDGNNENTITSNVIKEDSSIELTEELIEEPTITSNVVNEEITLKEGIQEETIPKETEEERKNPIPTGKIISDIIGEENCKAEYLDEYGCNGNYIQKKYQYSDCRTSWFNNYHCLYGCENGECIGSCSDTDGGKDYSTKGYIDYGDWKEYDECDKYNEDYLIEVYCDSGSSKIESYKCSYGCSDGKCNLESEEQSIFFTVTRVIDGDTIEIETGERVRLICIDTPETYEDGYQEAKDYLTNLILNKEIYLEKDISETDRYGRLLRYIYTKKNCTDLANCFINLRIVLQGYGRAYPYSPDTTLCPQIQTAESMARENKLGIWAETQQTTQQETTSSNSGYTCSYNAYNCDDFNTHAEAQYVFDACGGVNNDVHRLDRDQDGLACETLP